MPPKKRPLFGMSKAAKRMKAQRAAETPEERRVRLQAEAEREAKRRERETSAERQARLRANAERSAERYQRERRLRIQRQRRSEREAKRREQETSAERQARLRANAERSAERYQRERRLRIQRQRWSEREALNAFCLNRRAFNYNPDGDSKYEGIGSMGSMSELCRNCRAKKLPARESSGKNGASLSKPKGKSLRQHLSPSDIKVEHENIKKLKQSCSTAAQTQDSQNVCMSDANKLCLINGKPTLNPSSSQIKQEVPDCCEEIIDSNKVAETVNTLSKGKSEQASCFYKGTLNLSAIQTESKTLDCNNVPARILYSSSIEIDQDTTDSDNEAVQIQTLEINSVDKDIPMPQSELNATCNQEIRKETPDTGGNAQTSAKFSCIGVDQNILQQCNRDIDHTFDLANIKIKEEILDFEEESEVDTSLISYDEIKKEIPLSDNSSVPSTSSPGEQVILNNTKDTVRRSKRIAKNCNPTSKRKVTNKNCKMCQELNEKYEAEQMKCKDLEQKLKDADLKVLALTEKMNRISEEKMELQKKLSLQS